MYFNIFKKKTCYRPTKSTTMPDLTSSAAEKHRCTKSQFLLFLIFLLFITYLVLSESLPVKKSWFAKYTMDSKHYQETEQDQLENNPFFRPSDPDMACAVPRLNPFDKTIKHLIKFNDKVNCIEKFPLLFKSDENSTILPVTESIRIGYDSCCYRTVHRKDNNTDKGFRLSNSTDCYPLSIENSTKLVETLQHEFIAIFCKLSNKTDIESSTIIPTNSTNSTGPPKEKLVDMHVLVNLKPPAEKRVAEYYNKLKKSKDKNKNSTLSLEHERVNVVILGIDAVSHMNFLRVMPSVYSYLMNNLSAVEMQGFNKIGDNTYPNVGAILTSYNLSQLNGCANKKAYDDCPLIWKKYAAQGYRTSYAEDANWMSMFNFNKKGFKKVPTDYYLRPFGEAAEQLIGTNKKINAKVCVGPRLSFEMLLGYMKKLAHTMGHDKRYFQLIWATSLTHDYLNYGHLGEGLLLSALQWFQSNGHFNHTVFILMSDHGIRWGKIRQTVQGQLEERLPFLYFVLPEWFKKTYSRAYGNLLENVDRLTTHFDLYETLNDLLDLNSINSEKLVTRELEVTEAEKKSQLPRGISQFIPIPKSRTCEMAGVAEHYCTCHDTKVLDVNLPIVQQAANFVVHSINLMISKSAECAFLGLHMVIQALAVGSKFNSKNSYQVVLQTSPGEAVFESLVEKDNKGVWKVSGAISRTNLYGNQSDCITQNDLKLYCFCLDLFRT